MSRQVTTGRHIALGRRFVFDTATLVSAALRPSSPAAHAFSLALSTGIICSTEPALDQLDAIFNRRTPNRLNFDRYISRRVRRAFVDLLRRHAWLSPAPPATSRGRSSRTQQLKSLIAFAVSAEADALVTTPMPRSRPSRRTLPVLAPEEFLLRYAI
jgi:predicted nucleic acid-binding protein